MLEALIFDIGNVLLAFDFTRTFQRLAPKCEGNFSEAVAAMEPMKRDLESGHLSSESFLEQAARHLRFQGSREELVTAWQRIFDPIEATHRLVERLHGVLPLYLLSNTNALHAEYFLSEWPVFSKFSGAVYSHEARLMKPDHAIYAHAISKFGVRAGQTLFIDDLEPNVHAAREAGLLAHQYRAEQHSLLLQTLREHGMAPSLLAD